MSWEEKAEKIRRVYESDLFENVKDQNGNNPFLDYAAKRKGFTYRPLSWIDYFLIGFKTSRPPMNGLKTSGITTEPSAC